MGAKYGISHGMCVIEGGGGLRKREKLPKRTWKLPYISGVSPPVLLLTAAPAITSACTTAVCPPLAAQIIAVAPSALTLS